MTWLSAALPPRPTDSHWAQLAKSALQDELVSLIARVAGEAVTAGGLSAWVERHTAALGRAGSSYKGLAGGPDTDVAMLTVGVQLLRDLVHAAHD